MRRSHERAMRMRLENGDDGCGMYGSFALHSIGVWGLNLSCLEKRPLFYVVEF